MNGNELTERYLDRVKRARTPAAELIGTQPESDLLNGYYHGRYLTRPLFLGRAERDRLHQDLENLRSALIALPDRLFFGDLAAFARAVGMTDLQVSAVLRTRGPSVTRQSRADLYTTDGSGFRLLEYNMGSTVAGMDNADMCRALLDHPLLAGYAREHDLGYVDSMREQVNNMFAETGFAPDSRPVVALTDWPSSFETLEPYMKQVVDRWRELGLDPYRCHIGQLEARDGRIWLRGKPVDIISRLFMIEDLLDNDGAPALMNPVLDAAARGEVKIFTPMDAELFSSKGALAMLSDEQNRHSLSASELASLDRILPWTRMVRAGDVTLEDGSTVDLVDYALRHRSELALKPTSLHGGNGVLLGWHSDTDDGSWQEQVRAAVDGPFVVQRRIRPTPELFPADNGELVPWIVVWGVFTAVNGYGGVFARATTVESSIEVVNVGSGASAGCCLHATHE